MRNEEIKRKVITMWLIGLMGGGASLLGTFWSGAGKVIFDRTVLALPPDWGGTFVLFLLLAASTGATIAAWLWVTRERGALDGCVLVEEGGYYVDRKLGYAICPRCAVMNGERVGMMRAGSGYSCRVCAQVYAVREAQPGVRK